MKAIQLKKEHTLTCLKFDEISLNGLWNKEQWAKELDDPHRICLGFFKQSTLLAIACGWLVTDELQLTALAVHPEHRRKGLGQTLVKQMLKRAEESGARRAILEVSNENLAAISFYKKIGFKTSGLRKNYYQNGSHAILQWLDIRDLRA